MCAIESHPATSANLIVRPPSAGKPIHSEDFRVEKKPRKKLALGLHPSLQNIFSIEGRRRPVELKHIRQANGIIPISRGRPVTIPDALIEEHSKWLIPPRTQDLLAGPRVGRVFDLKPPLSISGYISTLHNVLKYKEAAPNTCMGRS